MFNGATQVEFNAVSTEMTSLYNILNREGTLVVEDRLLSSANVDSINATIGLMLAYLQTLVPTTEI